MYTGTCMLITVCDTACALMEPALHGLTVLTVIFKVVSVLVPRNSFLNYTYSMLCTNEW